MLDFVKRAFRDFFEVLLWINLIGSVISGGWVAYVMGGKENAFIGVILGAIVGIVTDIVGGGLIATFLGMDEKLGLLVANVKGQQRTGEKQRIERVSGYFTDSRDGQKYRTVEIGGKTWMAQNLNYLPQTGNSWCYDNDNSNSDKYGRLYDWNTAKSACPIGWRLPTRHEWNDLVREVGGKVAGSALKSMKGWSKSGNGMDGYDFSALPGGGRDSGGRFRYAGDYGFWWTASECSAVYAFAQTIYYGRDDIEVDGYDKTNGFSVRCVADE